jgi:hypothetical protein
MSDLHLTDLLIPVFFFLGQIDALRLRIGVLFLEQFQLGRILFQALLKLSICSLKFFTELLFPA